MNPTNAVEDTTKKKILVVDDEKSIRNACEMILLKEGYDVQIAGSGEEAIQTLKESRYDLVITDLQMYDIGGVELLEHVRSNYPGTDMIMMTGYGSTDTALKALKQGAYDYITKPFDLTALRSLVKRCLEKKQSSQVGLLGQEETLQSESSVEHAEKKITILERLRKLFRFSEEIAEVGINQCILDIIRMFSEHFSSLNIEVETDLLVGLPKVSGDMHTLEQVFINLITNARDALLQEPVKENKKIEIRSFVNEINEVVLSVKDNGCGIPASSLQFIFKPGFTTKSSKKGEMGFGLSYSKKIIEHAGGRIEYEPEESGGSTFTVILPSVKAQKEIPVEEPSVPEISPRPSIPQKKQVTTQQKEQVTAPQKKQVTTQQKEQVTAPQKKQVTTQQKEQVTAPQKKQVIAKSGKHTKKFVIGAVGILLFAVLVTMMFRYKRFSSTRVKSAAAINYKKNVEKLCLEYATDGKFKLAIAEYQKILDRETSSIEDIFKKGLNYKKENLLSESMVEFIKTIALESDYLEAYIELANIYKEKRMHNTAIMVCKQSLTIKSDYSLAQYTIASLYALKNDAKNSAKWLSWAAAQDSSHIGAARRNIEFDKVRNSPEFEKPTKGR